jgi:hypothetical protein
MRQIRMVLRELECKESFALRIRQLCILIVAEILYALLRERQSQRSQSRK